MRRAAIISLVLLWVWIAFTVSTDYYFVDGGLAFKQSEIQYMLPEARGRILLWDRELRVDYILLVWFLLPPVLLSPLLWQFWKKELPTHN